MKTFATFIDFPKNFILEMDIVPKKEGGRYVADVVLFGESSHSEMDDTPINKALNRRGEFVKL